MAELAPIPRGPAADAAFDVRALFAQGLDHVRTLARELQDGQSVKVQEKGGPEGSSSGSPNGKN